MAILKDLIVHGSSRFLNKIYASEIQTPLIDAEAGIFKKLKADDATVVGLLDVQGQMHTNTWSNSNIATIDGSFYIAPTLSSSSGTVSFSSATAATFTGTYSAVSSLYIGNDTASTVQWTSGSKILITGEVQVDGEWIPLGTLLGTLNSTNPTTSIPVVSITDNRNNTSNILTNIYSLKSNDSLSYRNLKISLYQRADNSEYYPLGIFMTALGQNGKTFLDIYGGVNVLTTSYGGYANPNVRIGNLSGLPAITTAAGNFSPVGWGIYTTNGYFSGTIVSNTGVIGGWKLGASSLYNGTTGLNNNKEGIYLGIDGIRNYKDINTYVNIVQGVIKAKGVNLTGQITATSGTIGGASITNGTLIIGNANINDINASKINAGDIAAARIETNLISAINAKVSDLSALTATIGGFQIDSSSIHTNNIAVTSNADNSIALSSTDFTRTINSTSRIGLRFAIGDKFGVTGDGTIYASNVDLTGKITATSGTIGGINIIDGDLDVSSINIGDLNGASNYALKTEITDAEKVATSYITYIDSTEGIKIHNISDQVNYLKLNSSAISMYRNNVETLNINNNEVRIGKNSGNNVYIDSDSIDIKNGQTVLATFGEMMQIGQNNKNHATINPLSFKLIDKEGNTYFHVSDLRESQNGTVEIIDTFIGEGNDDASTLTKYSLSFPAINTNYTVEVSDSSGEGLSKTIYLISFTHDVNEGAIITVTYETSSYLVKAYTLGFRLENSKVGGLSCGIGDHITASGVSSYAEGYRTIASARAAHAEGWCTTASGNGSHAEGSFTIASGWNSHAEGSFTTASGQDSHAEGWRVTASGLYSHAEGRETTASGNFSHAEGQDSIASGWNSHAEGRETTASGLNSHAEGLETIASSDSQHVQGKFNIEDTTDTYAFIIGNGDNDSTRSNAFTVDWDGNTEITGNLYCNGVSKFTGKMTYNGVGGLFFVKSYVYNASIAANGTWYHTDQTGITITNYKAIAIAGFGVWNDGGYCDVIKCYIWNDSDTKDILDIGIKNRKNATIAVKIYVKIFYIARNVCPQ